MTFKISRIKNIPSYFWRKLYVPSEFVKKPQINYSVISDLFIWRMSPSWKTFFELLDVHSLITGDPSNSIERDTYIYFFNQKGEFLFKRIITGNQNARNTLCINDLIEESRISKNILGEFGTFAVFHSSVEPLLNNALLTDRGYCGYEFSNSKFRGYVHGNFDAVALAGNDIESLMGYGILKRPYNLQHILSGPSNYEIAVVNPTNKTQRVKIKIYNGEEVSVLKLLLLPRGLSISKIGLADHESARVKIISQMYMARPSVFRYTKETMDVFHG